MVDKSKEPGIYKKVRCQKESFDRLGIDSQLIFHENGDFYANDLYIGFESQTALMRLKNRFFIPNVVMNYLKAQSFDYLYIRKFFINWDLIQLSSYFNKINVKVIIDIPTYPYKSELSGFLNNLIYYHENYYSKFLKKFIPYISYIGKDYSKIWGIDTIPMSNGVDLNKVKISDRKIDDKIIRFLGVANLASWHGYERFIYSMKNLEPELLSGIHFDIVGYGPCFEYLKTVIDDCHLNENVTLYGNLLGKELDDIFNSANIGVDALAMYKVDLYETSSLKTREYAARGIPFILSCNDPAYPKDCQFIFRVPNSHEFIDIRSICNWYKSDTPESSEIRLFAEQNLSWDKQMKKVLDKFNLS